MIRVVEVSIRDYDLRFFHHQRTMATPTDLTMEIYGEACRCLEELWTGVRCATWASTPPASPEP